MDDGISAERSGLQSCDQATIEKQLCRIVDIGVLQLLSLSECFGNTGALFVRSVCMQGFRIALEITRIQRK